MTGPHDRPQPASGEQLALDQAREELGRVANEQASLRRVATLVASGVAPADVLRAVTAEVGSVHGADATIIVRLDPDGLATVVARVGDHPVEMPVGSRWKLGPPLALAEVLETSRSARVDDYDDASGDFADVVHRMRIHSSVASPIIVEGRLWGAIAIGTKRKRFPEDTEQRMVNFTELIALAIANAEARGELMASRERLVLSADQTRRRLERDLHDGTQQRLVSVMLRLRAVCAVVPPELGELSSELEGITEELHGALDELRELARGIHPAILAKSGLEPALKALARRSAVPVDLDLRIGGRLPEPIEVAAYYVVSEALTNTAKHACASAVAVAVEPRNGVVHVRVSDDGIGGADFGGGSGLIGLKDRVAVLGGRIALESRPGAGTKVSAELPLTVGPDTVPPDT